MLRIATEEGVVDATVSIQLKQLRDAFLNAENEGD
jgi:flagellar biosynthesis/type III secretory pathway protein FliH